MDVGKFCLHLPAQRFLELTSLRSPSRFTYGQQNCSPEVLSPPSWYDLTAPGDRGREGGSHAMALESQTPALIAACNRMKRHGTGSEDIFR